MSLTPNVATVTQAAEEKGCSRQTIYNAIERGDLSTVMVGGMRMVARTEAYEAWRVRRTGTRVRGASERDANASAGGK